MPAIRHVDAQEARTKRIFLAALAAFSLTVLTVNGFMIYMASASWTGLSVENAYESGLDYNQRLEQARLQAENGWTSELAVSQAQPGSGTVEFRLVDAKARPLSGATVEMMLFRPTSDGRDAKVALVEEANGVYRADVAVPAPGIWDAYIAASTSDGDYHRRERLFLK